MAHFDVPKLTPHCMRVLLSQFYRDQWRLFKPSEFCFEFSMQNEVYFHSETEFLQATSALVGNALSCMALLEENKKMLVTAKDYYYMQLSLKTSEKAYKFSQQNHLELSATELIPWAKQWLEGHYIQQRAFSSLEMALEYNLPLFLSFCAYCGEILCRERNGVWRWYQDEQKKGYVVLWEDCGIDILGQAINYLSYCSILQDQRLFEDGPVEKGL